jgi:mercuric ion transport protein
MIIEIVYDADCPNIKAARAQLEVACHQAGVPPKWQEWDRADMNAPDYVRNYGSPTILVNGEDVAGCNSVDGSNCRLYQESDGSVSGAPAVAQIIQAITTGRP